MHSPLYYANADYVKASLYSKSELNPVKLLLTRTKAENKKQKAERRAKKAEVRRRKAAAKKHTRLDEEEEVNTEGLIHVFHCKYTVGI